MDDKDFALAADYIFLPHAIYKDRTNISTFVKAVKKKHPKTRKALFFQLYLAFKKHADRLGFKDIPNDDRAGPDAASKLLDDLAKGEKSDYLAPLLMALFELDEPWTAKLMADARAESDLLIAHHEGIADPSKPAPLPREERTPTLAETMQAIRDALESWKRGPSPVLPSRVAPDSKAAKETARSKGSYQAPTLFPHPEGIYSVAYSPCGRFIATAGRRGLDGAGVFVWRVDEISGTDKRMEIAREADDCAYVAFSPDGKQVAAAFEKTAGVFSAEAKLPRIHQFTHDDQITMIAYSPNGDRIVTASWDGTARIWDVETGRRLHQLRVTPHKGSEYDHVVNSAFFSPDGSQVVTGCTDGNVALWDAETGKKTGKFPKRHTGDGVSAAQFSPDGRFVVTTGATDPRETCLWDSETCSLVKVVGGKALHSHDLWYAEFSADGTRLVTAAKDGWSIVWDLVSDKPLARLKHPSEVFVAHFSPDGSRVVSACGDGGAYLWTIA